MVEFPTFKGSCRWPWMGSYCIPSCTTRQPLPTYQISLKSKKLFADGHLRPTLLGLLKGVNLKIPSFLKYVATLPCEIFACKNCHAPEMSEANGRARLSYSNTLLKYPSSNVNIIWSTDEKTFTVATLHNHKMIVFTYII